MANLDVRRSVILDHVDHTAAEKPIPLPEFIDAGMPMPDYMTVLAYTNLNGIKIPLKQIPLAGKALTKFCKKRKIKFFRRVDDRYGTVNLYSLAVLAHYFAHNTF